MTEWGVFGVIASVVTLGFTVGAPLLKLNAAITRLSTVIDIFQKQVENDKKTNNEEHVAIWNEVEKHGNILNEHETKIAILTERERGA